MCRLRNALLFSAAALSLVASSAARLNDGVGPDAVDAAPSQYDPAVPPQAHQLSPSYTFKQYLVHFDKHYSDPAEYDRRERTFARNLAAILRHNEGKMTPDGTVKRGFAMGVNHLTDADENELPMGYNKMQHPEWKKRMVAAKAARAATATERRLDLDNDAGEDGDGTEAYSVDPAFELSPIEDLPEEVDWSAKGKINPTIPQQGGCGSCWSFAGTALVEAHYAIATGEDVPTLSEQTMLECAPNPEECGGKGGCTGSTVELGLNYVAERTAKKTGGLFKLDDVTYLPSDAATIGDESSCEALTKGKTPMVGIEGWTKLPTNSLKHVMNALAKVGPLGLAVSGNSWGSYEKGVFESTATTVNHAVTLVGYGVDKDTGEKYWKIRNSWGKTFGEDGEFLSFQAIRFVSPFSCN
ncbi:hypothetical protein ACHAWF_016763 [Thalassiosira exigua]